MRDQKFTHAEVYRAARLSVAPMMDSPKES